MIWTFCVSKEPENLVSEKFGRFERAAIELCRFVNEDERAKRIQSTYLREFGTRWVNVCTRNLVYTDGLGRALSLRPERGVLLCVNHRSFFDSYAIASLLLGKTPWCQRIYFPVRANFFYERPAGVAVNAIIGGLCMYPPIFRDASRREDNERAVEKMTDFLAQPGTLVGMHPEGTRGLGPDPLELLPAQPGVGQLILRANPLVLPVFVNGLLNDVVEQVRSNFRERGKHARKVIMVFGDPVDLSEFRGQKPRAALYKRVADRVLDDIRKLGQREKVLRAQLDAAP
jgi:1-acyl-sn-glycerol-3-phosphate acyltransferase